MNLPYFVINVTLCWRQFVNDGFVVIMTAKKLLARRMSVVEFINYGRRNQIERMIVAMAFNVVCVITSDSRETGFVGDNGPGEGYDNVLLH